MMATNQPLPKYDIGDLVLHIARPSFAEDCVDVRHMWFEVSTITERYFIETSGVWKYGTHTLSLINESEIVSLAKIDEMKAHHLRDRSAS
jgi:hypothetical protein